MALFDHSEAPFAFPLNCLSLNSLRSLGVLGVSAVNLFATVIHRRDADYAEITQR